MANETTEPKEAAESGGSRLEAVVMPDAALIHAVGSARLKGASKDHLEILAHQVSYLCLQIRHMAATYDPDDETGMREYAQRVRHNCFEALAKILEA